MILIHLDQQPSTTRESTNVDARAPDGTLAEYYASMMSDIYDTGFCIVPTRVIAANLLRYLRYLGDSRTYVRTWTESGVRVELAACVRENAHTRESSNTA